jgi:hypothetical protein
MVSVSTLFLSHPRLATATLTLVSLGGKLMGYHITGFPQVPDFFTIKLNVYRTRVTQLNPYLSPSLKFLPVTAGQHPLKGRFVVNTYLRPAGITCYG